MHTFFFKNQCSCYHIQHRIYLLNHPVSSINLSGIVKYAKYTSIRFWQLMIDEYQLYLISEFRRGGGVTLLIQFRLNEKLKITVVIYVGRRQKMASICKMKVRKCKTINVSTICCILHKRNNGYLHFTSMSNLNWLFWFRWLIKSTQFFSAHGGYVRCAVWVGKRCLLPHT